MFAICSFSHSGAFTASAHSAPREPGALVAGHPEPEPDRRALAPEGIRVNGIAPSLMLRSSGQSEENFEAMHANNPLRRGVEPSDVVDAIRYLVEARSVTGQTLVIDSGQRFLGLDRDVQFL